jgi:serine/threonine protein kinase
MNDQQDFILAKRLAHGALAPEEALSIAAALAYAIRRLHQDGVLCGCLTPDHIVIGRRGARIEPHAPQPLTPYSAPEQILGQPADPRTDIFAFGAIFYEMLAGVQAFPTRDPGELREEILEREPAPLAGVSGEILRIVSRCLAKKPEQRWQRMNSVLIELKLAHATARQSQQAADWKEKIGSLHGQIAGLESKAAASRQSHDAAISELRAALRRIDEKDAEHAAQFAQVQEVLGGIRHAVAGLQQGAQIHSRAIESLEAAIAQTDEVVEHIVDAFGLTQKPMVARVEALTISHNGS